VIRGAILDPKRLGRAPAAQVRWSLCPTGAPVLPDRTPAGGVIRRPVPADGIPARRRSVRVARPVPAGACAGDDQVAGGAGARGWGRWGPAQGPVPRPASRTRRPCRRPRAPARAASASSGGRWSSGGTCVRQTRLRVGRNPHRAAIGGPARADLALDRGPSASGPARDLARPCRRPRRRGSASPPPTPRG
jgi:hypothetical protein